MGRRAETIILPLELLRHLKPSEFRDGGEYHQWQRRQLKVLEAGILLHPAVPLDCTDPFALRLHDIVRSSELRPVDTGRSSDTMRTLCNAVVSLAWRGPTATPTDACHWADGHPLNTHLYIALLRSIFDRRDETAVVDEVDELLELMKKTWSTLGVCRRTHNACLLWVLFRQYVATGQTEGDLLGACLTLAGEIAGEGAAGEVAGAVAAVVLRWAEERLVDYQWWFGKGMAAPGAMEVVVPLALSKGAGTEPRLWCS